MVFGNTMRNFQKTSMKRLREIEQTFNEKMISFDDEVSFPWQADISAQAFGNQSVRSLRSTFVTLIL